MKYFLYIIIGWFLWFIIYIPIYNQNQKEELIKKIEGSYTSSSIITENTNIYFTKNLKITFNDGKYYVYYDLYAKCSTVNYYNNNDRYYFCADDIETFINNTEATGTYVIDSNEQLILKLNSGATRTCKIRGYSNSIDCTDSGGWYYTKVK